MSEKKFSTKKIVTIALLIALSIILRLLGFPQSGIFRIELGFAPIAVCASLYGGIVAGGAYVIADIIGTLATGMAPFFPITICKFFMGVIFGIFFCEKNFLKLFKNRKGLKSIIFCNISIGFFVDLLLMPIALLPISGNQTLLGIITIRALALLLNIPLRTLTLWLVFKYASIEKLAKQR